MHLIWMNCYESRGPRRRLRPRQAKSSQLRVSGRALPMVSGRATLCPPLPESTWPRTIIDRVHTSFHPLQVDMSTTSATVATPHSGASRRAHFLVAAGARFSPTKKHTKPSQTMAKLAIAPSSSMAAPRGPRRESEDKGKLKTESDDPTGGHWRNGFAVDGFVHQKWPIQHLGWAGVTQGQRAGGLVRSRGRSTRWFGRTPRGACLSWQLYTCGGCFGGPCRGCRFATGAAATDQRRTRERALR
jgi:hypothetical protein